MVDVIWRRPKHRLVRVKEGRSLDVLVRVHEDSGESGGKLGE